LSKLAIVILNFNGQSFLEKFLPTVIAKSAGHEVIVADNCSIDNSVEYMKSHFPDVRLIINPENGGFAKGYNQALAQIESELYLLLNSDIEVTDNWLEPLLKKMENTEIAGCQPKVLAYHRKSHFEHAGASGGYLDTNYFPLCRGRIIDLVEEDLGQYDDEREVFWATGAAFMIRAEVFHSVGGFDEDFFAHMEEIDLCWRLKKRGHRFDVVPSSVVYHVGGGTLPYSSPFKTYLNFRNSLFMIIKNHDGWLFPMLLKRMTLDGVAGVRFVILGEWKQIKSLLEAHRDMHKNLSKFYRKRKAEKAFKGTFNRKGLLNKNLLFNRYILKIEKFSDLNTD
jgi:GT2 family glycosyltransferase